MLDAVVGLGIQLRVRLGLGLGLGLVGLVSALSVVGRLSGLA